MTISRLTERAQEFLALATERARGAGLSTITLPIFVETLTILDPSAALAGMSIAGVRADQVDELVLERLRPTRSSAPWRRTTAGLTVPPTATTDDDVAAIITAATDEAAANQTRADVVDLARTLAAFLLGALPTVPVPEPPPPHTSLATEAAAHKDPLLAAFNDRMRLIEIEPEKPTS